MVPVVALCHHWAVSGVPTDNLALPQNEEVANPRSRTNGVRRKSFSDLVRPFKPARNPPGGFGVKSEAKRVSEERGGFPDLGCHPSGSWAETLSTQPQARRGNKAKVPEASIKAFISSRQYKESVRYGSRPNAARSVLSTLTRIHSAFLPSCTLCFCSSP